MLHTKRAAHALDIGCAMGRRTSRGVAACAIVLAVHAPTAAAFVNQQQLAASPSAARLAARPLRPRARPLRALEEVEATATSTKSRRDKGRAALEHEWNNDGQHHADRNWHLDGGVADHQQRHHQGHQGHRSSLATAEQAGSGAVAAAEVDSNAALWGSAALLLMACVCGTNFPIIKQLETTHPEAHVAAAR